MHRNRVRGERRDPQGGVRPLSRGGVPDFERLDPEIEIINFDTFPVARRYHGWDGVVEWLVALAAAGLDG
jgi:hypothetical protein